MLYLSSTKPIKKNIILIKKMFWYSKKKLKINIEKSKGKEPINGVFFFVKFSYFIRFVNNPKEI